MDIYMTCGVPVTKSASKYYKTIRAPVRNAPVNIKRTMMCAGKEHIWIYIYDLWCASNDECQ